MKHSSFGLSYAGKYHAVGSAQCGVVGSCDKFNAEPSERAFNGKYISGIISYDSNHCYIMIFNRFVAELLELLQMKK
jgi:hypothetical protein